MFALSTAEVFIRGYSIALVSLGYQGYRSHFLSLSNSLLITVVAMCDTNLVVLESFSLSLGSFPTYTSLPQLLQHHTLDFAIISMPHGAHMECITALVAKGVAVLKEKPVAGCMEELLPLVGRVAAVEASLALNITNLEETWRASSGVGVMEDLGCHMLDILVWLFGLPTLVMAHQVSSVRPWQRYSGDNVCDILIDWGTNCIGHVRLSRVTHQSSQYISVSGTDGTLTLGGHDITQYDTQGLIYSMAQEFGDWVSRRKPDFSTLLANVAHTVSVVEVIKKSLVTRQVHPLLYSSSRPPPASHPVASFSTTSPPRTRKRFFHLNTGALIPAVGLGTRGARPLSAGYRYIDTSQSSKNEHEIARAIKDSGSVDVSLSALGMDYVDLYLMHWPVSINYSDPNSTLSGWDYIDTWYARNLGVSNFSIANLQRLLSDPSCKVIPAVNQVELHPYWPSRRLLSYCSNHGIHCTAYSPLGSANSPLVSEQSLLDISLTRKRSPRQVLYALSLSLPLFYVHARLTNLTNSFRLMWGIQRGTSVIPKSVNAARIKDNFQLDGWELSRDEMDLLDGCTTRFKSCSGDWLPGNLFFEDGD
ncbi:NADP-dependent oxidoreductase domain-containing protein [Aspergillus pseudodeflectus]|uniref:NADP-dependent oxidoreductase domain-containing protein n=1 Tax=Aspergillus pseudodeflectus TaxID=176178 RepID=A0ABR4KZH0_9EURO